MNSKCIMKCRHTEAYIIRPSVRSSAKYKISLSIGLNTFYAWIIMTLLVISGCTSVTKQEAAARKVLILTGQNNHEWEKTTAALLKMYRKLPGFQVQVTEDPEALSYEEISNYDVLVSNWNNWPENDKGWDPEQEIAFKRFVEEGGGAVFIHAGASSYYHSETYHQIGIGRWGENTSHGKNTRGKVYDLDATHPITRGIKAFYIIDEIWEKPDIYPGARVLARISGRDEDDGHAIHEDAVYVNSLGKGRCFYTILGHDERALFNTGLQTLLLRATEWVATGSVSIEVPQELHLRQDAEKSNYHWNESDTTFQFFKGDKLVWQYNFRNRYGKPYFHPVYLDNTRLTCESPSDHVWHSGLWFSWKFINGLNYWEYTDEFMSERTGFKSEGITDIQDIAIQKNSDHSASIRLDILYHAEGGDPALREKRTIHVIAPDPKGDFYFDYEFVFSAEFGDVTIDRTPILGEPGGQSWGGYGGLSVRFSQDFTDAETLPVIPPFEPPDYPTNGWFYMGYTSLTGEKAGMAILQHPDYTTEFTRWYFIINPAQPFFFFSPAAVYNGKIELKKGDVIMLKYRVWVLSTADEHTLEAKYHDFMYE